MSIPADHAERERLLAAFVCDELADGEWERLMAEVRGDAAFAVHVAALAAQQPALGDVLHGDGQAQRFTARVVAARPRSDDGERFTADVLARWRTGTAPRRSRWSHQWRWYWAAAALMVAAAAGWWLLPGSAPRTAWLVVAEGATVIRGSGTCTADRELPLALDDRVTVSAGSADILAEDGSILHLGTGSMVACHLAQGLCFDLAHGRIEAVITPQSAGPPCSIRTQDALVEVHGTRFTVERDDGPTRVAVSSGRVRCQRLNDGTAIELGAGQGTAIAASGPLAIASAAVEPAPDGERLRACAAVAEAMVRSGDGADTVQGHHGCLLSKWSRDPGANVRREIYLRFPLGEIGGPLRNARLRLWVDHLHHPPFRVAVEVVAADWDADTITWNRRPADGPTIATWTPVDRSLNEVDITAAVAAALRAGRTSLSLRVRAIDQSAGTSLVAFSSSAAPAPQRPCLLVATGP